MKLTTTIQPQYIIAITIGIAALMFVSAFVELQQSREELFHVLEEHSVSLSETIERSSENIVLSSEYIERQMSERLFNNALFVASMDSSIQLNQKALLEICRKNDIYRINVFNKNGNRILTSHPPMGFGFGQSERFMPRSFFDPILRGDTDKIVIGFRQARFSNQQRYAVAIRRTHPSGGIIVLTMDARQVSEFRKSIGISKLISDFSNNSEIEYVTLQDDDGIIVATDSVDEMSNIANDSALIVALQHDSVITRQTMFHNREVFEVIRAMTIEGSVIGVLRIGLSMDEIRSVEDRMKRRLLIMTLVFIAIGAVVMTSIIANQNFRILSKRFERAQAFTENILYTMQDMVISIDGNDRVTLFNLRAEEFFSQRSEDVIGRSLREIPDEVRMTVQSLLSLNDGNSECIVKKSDGKEYILSVTISRTVGNDGLSESRTLLIKDRTEATRLEREIQRKEKLTAMGELASGVAHEIRNPLNAISMIAQRYEKEFSPKNDVREYHKLTQVLKKETSRVNGIIQQFLKFARPQKVQKEDIPADEFASHIITLISPLTTAKGIELRSSVEEMVLHIDGEQMTQAMLNLLQNAVDATERNGTIVLSIQRKNNWAEICVTDTGTGIPDDQKEKIFNLYYTTKSDGTGIGLAVTHQIVAQHDGSIEVKSENGKGTSFILRLPSG